MNTFHKYRSIVRLDKRPEILTMKEVVATEKLHGTNFRVFFPEGMGSIDEVQYGGRNETFGTDGGEDFYGGRPVRWFKDRPELLERLRATFGHHGFGPTIVYGEICGPGIQKGVRYTTGQEIFFRAFDIAVADNFVTYDLFTQLCDEAELPRVPEVWRGAPSVEAFDALVDKVSVEGLAGGVDDDKNLSEGVVIRSNPLLRTVFGEWLIIKHKSKGFEEVASAKREPPKGLDAVHDFTRRFVTRGRLLNAVGRLRDSGVELEGAMSDMRHLGRAVFEDLRKECGEQMQVLLDAEVSEKLIRGTVSKAAARFYRAMLTEGVV